MARGATQHGHDGPRLYQADRHRLIPSIVLLTAGSPKNDFSNVEVSLIYITDLSTTVLGGVALAVALAGMPPVATAGDADLSRAVMPSFYFGKAVLPSGMTILLC